MRDRLIELIRNPIPVTDGVSTFGERTLSWRDAEIIADRIIANGTDVWPISLMTAVFCTIMGFSALR